MPTDQEYSQHVDRLSASTDGLLDLLYQLPDPDQADDLHVRMIGEVAHKVEAVRVELKQQMQEEYRQYALTNPIE